MRDTYEADADTIIAIMELRKMFGVRTNVAVIRKALALAYVCKKHQSSQHHLTIVSGNGELVQVCLGD